MLQLSMPKILKVDQNKCIGCNTCPLLDPDHFQMDPNSYKAKVKKQPEKITSQIKNTIASCPVGAISIE